MEHIEIPGARIPKLGLGTWQLTGEECRRSVAEAIGLGYRHVDTAQMYRNEAEVGAAIMDSGVPREEFFLTTKIWKDSLTHARALATFDQSLEKLVTACCPLARNRVADDATVRALADEVGRIPAQVALRWLVQQPAVAAIPKASSREHLKANLAVFDFELDPEQVRRLDAVATGERCVDPAQV